MGREIKSTDYAIGCHACKEKIHIGQTFTIYQDQETLSALREFLYEHRGHRLLFDMSAEEPLALWSKPKKKRFVCKECGKANVSLFKTAKGTCSMCTNQECDLVGQYVVEGEIFKGEE